MEKIQLDVIYHDPYLVAINKPPGLLVHKTPMAGDASPCALQVLRDQIHQRVYPCHRLDRKTSGVLLFALDPKTNRLTQAQFSKNLVAKVYLAIVRGFTEETGTIDYPLVREDGTIQDARTSFITIARSEIPLPYGKHNTSRYSLIRIKPLTGRTHQIRKHLAHIFHPIIGDRPYGCNKQNKLFKEKWGMSTMMLHAISLEFVHPVTGELLKIEAKLHDEFIRMLKVLELNNHPIE
ncbi:MAG: pseudouridylate synthase [Bacteroidetes bacterium]|nr:pseudouridylate synthase [Bacteroidota bacterium]